MYQSCYVQCLYLRANANLVAFCTRLRYGFFEAMQCPKPKFRMYFCMVSWCTWYLYFAARLVRCWCRYCWMSWAKLCRAQSNNLQELCPPLRVVMQLDIFHLVRTVETMEQGMLKSFALWDGLMPPWRSTIICAHSTFVSVCLHHTWWKCCSKQLKFRKGASVHKYEAYPTTTLSESDSGCSRVITLDKKIRNSQMKLTMSSCAHTTSTSRGNINLAIKTAFTKVFHKHFEDHAYHYLKGFKSLTSIMWINYLKSTSIVYGVAALAPACALWHVEF